ncbi:MAG: MotA/TolQ/ExbB proton channel family protein [Thiomonas sp.]|nr:MotA/TolQ/ExbB proton channel family protein [Thiomonas sp.]
MGGLAQFWQQGDALSHLVALLLLAMSMASWFVILWKAALLGRAVRRVPAGIAAYWGAPSALQGVGATQAADPEGLSNLMAETASRLARPDTAHRWQSHEDRVTRELRDALQAAQRRLQAGHVLLASVGSTAPFVGLFGTVWGIYHALTAIAASGQISVDKVAGPVGETLIMTAAGLAVAIPAVLAYNALSKRARRVQGELEGFAHDLQRLLAASPLL